MTTAILASQNKNKIKEIRDILLKYDMDVITRDDAGLPRDETEENGMTFEENSLIKAEAVINMINADPILCERYSESPVIADDSGLMVDALGGAPGVHSARYAGENHSYADNNAKLLSELINVKYEDRTAHFVTVITMIYPKGVKVPAEAVRQGGISILTARGECYGHIATELRGSGGFGYDPVFIPDGFEKSFAELGTDFKNTISHRAKALKELDDKLKKGMQKADRLYER